MNKEEIKITCNGGYCQYQYQEGTLLGCRFKGYCDYQCPKDSRKLADFQKEG